jgi:hypothetical protein
MGIGWLVDEDAGSCKMNNHVSNVQIFVPNQAKKKALYSSASYKL